MRSVDRLTRWVAHSILIGSGLLGVGSCADGFAPLSSARIPEGLVATAVRVDAVRLSWLPVDEANIVSYEVYRRTNLAGPFIAIAQVPQTDLSEVVWLDTDVAPETFYGYRVVAVTSVGNHSKPSVIGGALTPPPPGIEISTQSLVTAAESLDPDGYEVLIAGPDSVRASIGVETRRRFSPLRPGTYVVTLSGIVTRCAVTGATSRTVDVTDTTAITIIPVHFQLTCRDPNRGDIAVQVQTSGQAIDPEYRIDVLGQADDTSLPAVDRNYSSQRTIGLSQPSTTFSNVRPGTYDVTLEDLAPNCTVSGPPTRSVTITPLAIVGVTYAVACLGEGPPPSSAPFVWRNRWSLGAAPNGASVSLVAELDLTARAGQGVKGVQADLYYDPSVLSFVQEVAGQLPLLTVNVGTPGRISFIASTTGAARTGVVRLAEFEFSVVGAAGLSTVTTTQNVKAGSPIAFQDSVRVEEDTFVVSAGTGINQPPNAEANGPYAGVAGTPIALSALGSSDPDGSIVSYQWSYGDATTGSGATASKTYAAAGTYSVTLTVTDDDGATDTDQASVTIGSVVTPNLPPVAEANGPYSASAGTPFTLSSIGSLDSDGSIVSHSWALGNGQTVVGPAPSATYAAAGNYTVTLTVTDDDGSTDTDQGTVTVGGATSTRPLVWRTEFGPLDIGNNLVAVTISYDLRTNLAETPGAEALQSFTIDSLKWDPSVLQFSSISLGPNVTGGSNQSGISSGRLGLNGSIGGALQQGLIMIATVRFRPVGPSGAPTTTASFLGALLGAASTNFFVYNSRTAIVEGTFVVP